MNSVLFYAPVDPAHLKAEKAKARELRSSTWWKQKIQSGVCYYCEKKFASTDLTMDHKVPIGRGGKSTKSNVVVCCKVCNSKKQSQTPAEMILSDLEPNPASE